MQFDLSVFEQCCSASGGSDHVEPLSLVLEHETDAVHPKHLGCGHHHLLDAQFQRLL